MKTEPKTQEPLSADDLAALRELREYLSSRTVGKEYAAPMRDEAATWLRALDRALDRVLALEDR